MIEKQNPWFQIPAEDYEGHMSEPHVGQLEVLSRIFADVLKEFSPKLVCVLGCATGNGFEHLANLDIDRIVGVDINPEYIAVCKNRFEQSLPNLELVCADLLDVEFEYESFDLVHAALIFEYLFCHSERSEESLNSENEKILHHSVPQNGNIDLVLSKISRWLKPNGVLCAVLQLPSEISALVSETPYESVKILNSFIKLVDPIKFEKNVTIQQLKKINEYNLELNHGKSFYVGVFEKLNVKSENF